MLTHLHIVNFTLIDTLDMRFFPGFSVITGETGAGKSIIIGAVNLLLGQRADSKAIKNGCERCIVEARFDIGDCGLRQLFDDNDIDYDDECILRRELTSTGKSRAFINDTPVSLAVMRQIGRRLVDIHSQHQNLLLGDDSFQLGTVDIIAQDSELLDAYGRVYSDYCEARRLTRRTEEAIERSRADEDYLRFQLHELEAADLSDGMQERLEQESAMLSHIEEIKTALYSADDILNGSSGVVGRLREASRLMADIKDIYPEAVDVVERLESSYIELKDLARDISSSAGGMDYDPQRLERVNAQLDTVYTLLQKHHVSDVAELIALRDKIGEQIERIDNGADELRACREHEAKALEQCSQCAADLTELRRGAATKIEKEMKQRLVTLGMPNVRFAVNISERQLCESGQDSVVFLFSANAGSPMQPVGQVASGGEIARVMLSLKAMISGTVGQPTIIFDEIDTGVSGKTAGKMAHIMSEMGDGGRQVVSITHLPQIAARGTTHYKVYKEEAPQGTVTRMIQLDDDGRVGEIAQMLSGSAVTEAAVNNARELLRGEASS